MVEIEFEEEDVDGVVFNNAYIRYLINERCVPGSIHYFGDKHYPDNLYNKCRVFGSEDDGYDIESIDVSRGELIDSVTGLTRQRIKVDNEWRSRKDGSLFCDWISGPKGGRRRNLDCYWLDEYDDPYGRRKQWYVTDSTTSTATELAGYVTRLLDDGGTSYDD